MLILYYEFHMLFKIIHINQQCRYLFGCSTGESSLLAPALFSYYILLKIIQTDYYY
jgi:hypothetical protein